MRLTPILLALTVTLASHARADPFKGPLKSSQELVPAPWAPVLDREVAAIRRSYSGDLFAYVSDPYRGYRWGFNAERPTYLASGVKVLFMLEVFRQRQQGKLSFDDTVLFTEQNLRDGAPQVNKLPLNQPVRVGTLVELMMRYSDNAASDMLAEKVGLPRIQAGVREEGLLGITPLTYLIDVRRGVFGEVDPKAALLSPLQIRTLRWTPIWEPQVRKLTEMVGKPKGTYRKSDLLAAYDRFYAKNLNNAPMASMGLLFEKMVRGELIDAPTSLEMLNLMATARTSTHRLMGRLPPGTRVSHKTGSQFQRICDLGVIHLPDQTPLIATICTAGGGAPASEAAIARLARKAYDVVLAEHRKK